ncbi:ribonuclease H-like domain-containing protein [Tanacetum coccineum]
MLVVSSTNGVHGKSTYAPRTSGSASSVPGVTRSNLDMLQSLLAKFGLNAPNISTPSPLFAYTVSVSLGFQSVSAQLSAQPTYGVQTLSGPPQGVHLVPGTLQSPIQFTIGVQQQHRVVLSMVRVKHSLANAFYTTTLQEPASGNWNMDTGASSHLNDSVHCLVNISYLCILPVCFAVGGFIIEGATYDVIARVSSILLRSPPLYLMLFLPVSIRGTNDLDIQEMALLVGIKARRVDLMVDTQTFACSSAGCQEALFLHGDLAETVYMHQPPGFRGPEHPDYVCKYAMEILERAHMVGCNSSRTPVDTESKLGDGGIWLLILLISVLEGSLLGLWSMVLQLFSSTTDSLIASLGCMRLGWLPDYKAGVYIQGIVFFLATTYSLGPLSVSRRFLVPVLRLSIVVLPMLLLRHLGSGILLMDDRVGGVDDASGRVDDGSGEVLSFCVHLGRLQRKKAGCKGRHKPNRIL